MRYDANACNARAQAGAALMSAEQLATLDAVKDASRDGQGGAIYAQAPGGTGETRTRNTALGGAREAGGVTIAAASSGIAAALLDGGRTFHSRLKAPILRDANIARNIPAQSGLEELIRQAKFIIWGEIPMARRNSLERSTSAFETSCPGQMPHLDGPWSSPRGVFATPSPFSSTGAAPRRLARQFKNLLFGGPPRPPTYS